MKPMNAFVWGFSGKLEGIISDLINKKAIDVKYWVQALPGKDMTHNSIFEATFPASTAISHNIKHADDVYNSCAIGFMSNQTRHSFHRGVYADFHDMEDLFWKYYYYYYDILVTKSINLVLFSNCPHEGSEVILYNIAQTLGIQTILTTQCSQWADSSFILHNIEDMGFFKESVLLGSPNMLNLRVPEKSPWYMQWKEPDFWKVWKPQTEYLNRIKPLIHKPDYSKKYIYVPLQMCPEMPVNGLGGKFHDQALMIERLSLEYPDCFLYIKENPKQTFYQRGKYFFQRISEVPNAVWVDDNTFDLIKNSYAVATVTGNAGYEALLHGKPVIVFGRAWYKALSGVKYDYHQPLVAPDQHALKTGVAHLRSKTLRGSVDPNYFHQIKNFNLEKNNKNIAEGIYKNLLRYF